MTTKRLFNGLDALETIHLLESGILNKRLRSKRRWEGEVEFRVYSHYRTYCMKVWAYNSGELTVRFTSGNFLDRSENYIVHLYPFVRYEELDSHPYPYLASISFPQGREYQITYKGRFKPHVYARIEKDPRPTWLRRKSVQFKVQETAAFLFASRTLIAHYESGYFHQTFKVFQRTKISTGASSTVAMGKLVSDFRSTEYLLAEVDELLGADYRIQAKPSARSPKTSRRKFWNTYMRLLQRHLIHEAIELQLINFEVMV